jgi:hypothetical protein
MVQHIIIFVLFIVAAAYMLRLLYRTFFNNNTAGCAKGCGSCGAIDFKKIEQDLEKQKQATLPTV